MSETGSSGRSGRGRNEHKRRGRGREQGYTSNAKIQKSGLCKALDSNVFDYRHKAAADEMRTSWEKLAQYAGTSYGQDISNELHNKTTDVIPEPVHTAAVITRHAAREQMIRTGQANLQRARLAG
jgi:protein-disulfide isomerase-like protein with CxxC motif